MTYTQLTREERYQIQALKDLGLSRAAIARKLSRAPSTIAREIRRNSPSPCLYVAERAMKCTRERRVIKGEKSRRIQGALCKLIELKLRHGWSPEQISGRLRTECGVIISHE